MEEVIETELKCVQRDCCRLENECAKCDLVLPKEEIINAYNEALKLKEENKKLKKENTGLKTQWRCKNKYMCSDNGRGVNRMTDEEKAKSIIPYQEKGYIFDEDLHEIYFRANGELMVKASVVEELKAQIEKMKNCENCRYAYDKKHDCMPCENMEDWELME